MSDEVRVVITGVGPVSPIGIGREEYCKSLLSGVSGAAEIESFDTTGFDHSIACEVKNLPGDEHVGRASQFALKAAQLAIEDAGISIDYIRGVPTAIYMGTTDGESQILDVFSSNFLHNETPDKRKALGAFPFNLSQTIARAFDLYDVELMTIATACSAGNYSIGAGYDAIRAGDADIALAGGADAVCRKAFTGFYRLGTVAPERCQPFDLNRKGILTAEGAGVVIMESLEHALDRGAHIYGEVAGYALSCDAHHAVAPDIDGVAACVDKALRLSDTSGGDVDLISAHGTGTRSNDVTECSALRKVFEDDIPPVISMKSMLGHTMGASSALAAIGCLLAMEKQMIPPTINFQTADPDCAVDCVPNKSVAADLNTVMNDGLAFGGNSAVVVLKRI